MALISSVFFGVQQLWGAHQTFRIGFKNIKYSHSVILDWVLDWLTSPPPVLSNIGPYNCPNVHYQVPLAAPCEKPENSVCLPTPGTHSQQPGTPGKVSKWLTWSAKRKNRITDLNMEPNLVISDYGEICNPNWESNRKTWKDGKSDEDLYFLPPSPSQRHSNGVILQLAHLRKQAPPLTRSRGEKAAHKMQLWDEKGQQCCGSPGLQTKHTKAPIKWSALSCQHSVAAISKRGFP